MNNSEILLNSSKHLFDSEITVLIDQLDIENEELQIRKTIKMIFCIAYALLFIFGTLGNGIVIVMICNILTAISRKSNNRKMSRKLSGLTTAHPVFIYVLGLSIVDFLVILHLPLLISEMLNGQWIFGNFLCKLYWYGESVNKLLSSFLMTVLSWDRYMAVCSPFKSYHVRKNSVAITILISCSVVATLLLYPVLKDSMVLKVDKLTGYPIQEDELGIDHSGQTVYKCIFDTNTPFFMLYTFLTGYVIPALLISFFYLRVILKLRSDALSVRKHSSDGHITQAICGRFQIVTKRIVAVVLFYFFCWTPYWTLNILSQFNIIIVSWSTLTLSCVFFSAHLLVCFNSAANPVLYALINRELRQQHQQALQRRKQSMHVATTNALEFFEKYSHRIPSPVPISSSSNALSISQQKPLIKESRGVSIGCSAERIRFGSLSGFPQKLNGMRRLLSISSFQELRSFSFSQTSLLTEPNSKTAHQNQRSSSTTANTEITTCSNSNSNTPPTLNDRSNILEIRRNALEPQQPSNGSILMERQKLNEETDFEKENYDEDCFL